MKEKKIENIKKEVKEKNKNIKVPISFSNRESSQNSPNNPNNLIFNPNNFQYRRKRQSTFDYTNDKSKFTFDAFNKDEIELLKSLKKQIKDSYG